MKPTYAEMTEEQKEKVIARAEEIVQRTIASKALRQLCIKGRLWLRSQHGTMKFGTPSEMMKAHEKNKEQHL